MQHRHSSIRIVDNLAEITRHHDRQVLEKSLLKTLNELFPAQSLRLFRIKRHDLMHDISLLAFCVNDVISSSEQHPKLNQETADELTAAMTEAIDKEDIVSYRPAEDNGWNVIYPAYDSHGEIFASLVHHCQELPSNIDQRLVHGILRVYANYLALIDKSQRDKLTGLYNRETLDEQITKILVNQSSELNKLMASPNDSRRRRYAIKHWLGVVDIDKFKIINDTYGHLYGDEVIILVARLMTSGVIRDDDLIYRFGGEEFVVLLKAANETDAMQAFERIRRVVAEHNFPQLGQVTVSIGYVEVSAQLSPTDVIGQADEALYSAKNEGRNQVQNYHTLVAEGKISEPKKIASSDVELF